MEQLQQIIREKGINSISPIITSFNEVEMMKIPLIIECIIEFEIQLEKMRFEMNVSQIDVSEYFNSIDIKRNGFIYYDDIQIFLMKYIDDNIENRIGIDLFFLRLDKNRKDKVFLNEFYEELKY